MGMTVNTNTASNNALTQLGNTTHKLTSTFERISSGLRINRASDDAAGLGMAEKLDATGRGLRQAMRNSNDGVSVIEVAEGASNEVANILKRMRELAVQSSSETLGNTERAYIQTEFTTAMSEISRIAEVTEFNGVKLSNSTLSSINVQVGALNTTNDRINIKLGSLKVSALGLLATVSLSTSTKAQSAILTFTNALDKVNNYRATFGATQNRIESAMRNLETTNNNTVAAESRIRDADFAYETANMAKYQIVQQAGVAVLGQANQMNQAALRLIQ